MTASSPRPAAPDTTGELREDGCDCGRTDFFGPHAKRCALELCRRCGMVGPDHLPGDDYCHPACGRQHVDDPALRDLLAERDTLAAKVQAVERAAGEIYEHGDSVDRIAAQVIRRALGTPTTGGGE